MCFPVVVFVKGFFISTIFISLFCRFTGDSYLGFTKTIMFSMMRIYIHVTGLFFFVKLPNALCLSHSGYLHITLIHTKLTTPHSAP